MARRKIYHSWIHPSLVVKRLKNVGKGVFADEEIKKGCLLVIFGGYIFTRTEELSFPSDMNDYAHHILPDFVIGIRKKSELQPVDYINHSCQPNAGFKGQIFLVSMRNIKKGEQITFDYCMVLSKPKDVKKIYQFNCECGAKDCRRVITWNDWKNPILQKKYAGYFQWYLEEKIRSRDTHKQTLIVLHPPPK